MRVCRLYLRVRIDKILSKLLILGKSCQQILFSLDRI
jgi:hypothetical protein